MQKFYSADQFLGLSDRNAVSVIFGGTFDPIHEGHIADLRFLLANTRKVLVAPTTQNPWKSNHPTSLENRIAMIELTLDFEGIRYKKSVMSEEAPLLILDVPYNYSIDLVNTLKQKGYSNLMWAIGEDLRSTAHTWKDWDDKGIPFLVLPIVSGFSATKVRSKATEAHPAIASYITKNGLYLTD